MKITVSKSDGTQEILTATKVILEDDTVVQPTPEPAPTHISLNLSEPKQTMKGWSAVAQIGQWECQDFLSYAPQVYDMAVNDLGVNRLRIEAYSGMQATTDWFSQWQNKTIDNATWKSKRYESEQNAPIHMTMIDSQMTHVVLPMINRWNAKNRKWALTLCYVDFTPVSVYSHRKDPQGYANFVLAIFKHLKTQYNIVPDGLEIILEHDISGWSITNLNGCISAVRSVLKMAGFTPDIIGPSSANATNALNTYHSLASTSKPDVFSYHRYEGATSEIIAAIGTKSRTAMIEWGGADINTIWDDLTIANVEEWMQFGLAFCGNADNGYKYIFGMNPPKLETRAYKLKHFFREVDIGAVRYSVNNVPTGVRVVGFKHSNGKIVFVVESQNAMSLSFGTGNWKAFHTPINGATSDVVVPTDGKINIEAGLLTIFSDVSVNPVPEPSPSPSPSPTPTTGMAMGMNLEPITFWDVGLPFIDHMKFCGAGGTPTEPWVSINRTTYVWNDGQPVSLDQDGYVKLLQSNQLVATLTKSGFGGRFVLKWDGQGELQVDNASSTSGRLVFDKPANQEIKITIRSIDPTNYPRNIRLTLEKYELSTEMFYPEYLDKLKDFSCLRFMDWMRTNFSQAKNVSDLKPISFLSQSNGKPVGVALKIMAELCNLLQKDCWICIPHMATDALVVEIANQMSLLLNKNLKLYVEYSNECWNGMFSQTTYVQQQAGLSGIGNDYDAGQKWYGRRARQVMEIFETYFPATQLVRVFAHQNGNTYHTKMALDFEQNKSHFDVLAIAPYFGRPIRSTEQTALQQQGKQFVLDMCQAQIDENVGYAKLSKGLADQYGLKLITYEGGQHFLASPDIHNNDINNQIIMQVQRDPAIKTFYLDYLSKLEKAGVSLFNHFTFVESFGKWSMFGCLESMTAARTLSPKWDALLTFLKK